MPSFLVVGPPRTGTSWLHSVLEKHAWLPSPTKETRFFDTHFQRGLSWYRAHYPLSEDDRLVGEVAPTYFASEEARQRISEFIPDVKIVCVFRNPVDRVYSLYRVKLAYGM
ncbi:MAG: sulfotransferase, partial [Acidobacteriales bacterium]|nr:sulfotransferase [Terriglobales bacterium]